MFRTCHYERRGPDLAHGAGYTQGSLKSQLFCLEEPLRSNTKDATKGVLGSRCWAGGGVATYIFRVRACLHRSSFESQHSVLESQTSSHGCTHTSPMYRPQAWLGAPSLTTAPGSVGSPCLMPRSSLNG